MFSSTGPSFAERCGSESIYEINNHCCCITEFYQDRDCTLSSVLSYFHLIHFSFAEVISFWIKPRIHETCLQLKYVYHWLPDVSCWIAANDWRPNCACILVSLSSISAPQLQQQKQQKVCSRCVKVLKLTTDSHSHLLLLTTQQPVNVLHVFVTPGCVEHHKAHGLSI